MTNATIDYVGPTQTDGRTDRKPKNWHDWPWAFIVIVIVPTLIAALYFFVIASPRYVSEARFVVRSSDRVQASSWGLALQGVGLSAGQTDAFAVHEYVTSRDGLSELQKRFDVRKIIGRPEADFLSRFPRFWENGTDEGLYKSFQRFVTVGYDSTTGISTLRVEAFTSAEAQSLAEAMLQGGESIVNRLNERSARDAISAAERAEKAAMERLQEANSKLTAFRNREGFIDPALKARESTDVISALLVQLAQARAERDQIRSQARDNPLLPTLDARIAAFERQLTEERAKLAGGAASLAPSVGQYQDLVMERELADRQYAEARAAMVVAQQEASRQKLYLERIVNPNRPDKALEPKRAFNVLAVFATLMLLYGMGWLVWAGVREHRQD